MCVSGWGKGEKGLFVGGCVCGEVVVYGEKGMSDGRDECVCGETTWVWS